jgi:xanthine dehydrogenase small subunit
MPRDAIRFLRRGHVVELPRSLPPTTMLLDWLRLHEGACGTKEGCNEGDCGACTVVLRRATPQGLTYTPVNACILMAGQTDGAEVITVEDLADGAVLHPVQQAMVDVHGSQCGFCTPGFVMALFAHYHDTTPQRGSRQGVIDQIAGNLCRCTGYRPIVEAGMAACAQPAPDTFDASARQTAERLAAFDDAADLLVGSPERFFAAPASTASLAKVLVEHPDATILAGGTDVGLWVTKALRQMDKIVWLGRARDLAELRDEGDHLLIGAGVTYAQAQGAMAAIDPDIAELWRRIGGTQVRASGTICGNIANGSPIGDTPPALVALGATLVLQKGERIRRLPLEDFFRAYKVQDREPGEFVRAVEVPKLRAGEVFRACKLSKRNEQDISAVMMGMKLTITDRRIAAARVAFGGMAATPKRAAVTEAALIGASLDDEASWHQAMTALDQDFTPIDDMRASGTYRRRAARGLLQRALAEMAGAAPQDTRVLGLRAAE